MSLYSCNSCSQGAFAVAKIDEGKRYRLLPTRNGHLTCECPGFARRFSCRHQEIVKRFTETQRHSRGWLHDFEADTWHQVKLDID